MEVLPVGDIAFSLPEYGYTDRAEDVKLLTKNDLGGSVVWTLTKDGTAQNLANFTKDGGTLSLTEAGKYTLTADADKLHEDEAAAISLTMEHGTPLTVE